MYKKIKLYGNDVGVIKDEFIAIPFDPANTDYQTYLKWLSEGNKPLPTDEPTE
jgi:hypothetical protein